MPAIDTPAAPIAAVGSAAIAASPRAAPVPAPERMVLDLASEAPAEEDTLIAQPAPLWRRLIAFTIDSAVVLGVLYLFILAAVATVGHHAAPSKLTGLDAMMANLHTYQSVVLPCAILGVLLATTYCAAFASLRSGRTLGRWAMGLKLVDARGSAPSVTRAVIRAVLAVVSFGFFLVGFWLALFDRKGQALHDKLTSTFVVRPL